MAPKKKKTPLLTKAQQRSDVQVRIYNTSLNFHKALEMPASALGEYLDRLRMEGRDVHGRPNHDKFANLPLVSFVDSETREEIVFKTHKDLPEKGTEIRSSKGTLVANFF